MTTTANMLQTGSRSLAWLNDKATNIKDTLIAANGRNMTRLMSTELTSERMKTAAVVAASIAVPTLVAATSLYVSSIDARECLHDDEMGFMTQIRMTLGFYVPPPCPEPTWLEAASAFIQGLFL
ncbi:uncharacterized protein LOC128203696 [Mya arenaria]|uniref:uncharacterized protein LOC128203696 n=1 Tax=Mya arenaria TaxID=6604 RepID=UPI0022E903F1|nr:uncharacterized protein LOC128203696 [Mya arenaria]